jgi:hypothetical protein
MKVNTTDQKTKDAEPSTERPCDVLSTPAPESNAEPPGPVDIYREFQAGRPPRKLARPIRCF